MNDTTFQGDGKVAYVPVVVNAKPKSITNADRIRAMTDEELASFITSDLCELLCGSPLSCDGDCEKKMLDWLSKEANDGKEEKEENQPAK